MQGVCGTVSKLPSNGFAGLIESRAPSIYLKWLVAKLTTTFENRLPGPSGHSQTPDSLSIAGPGHPRPGAGPRTSGPQVHGTPWVRVHPSGDALCLHPSLPLSLSRGVFRSLSLPGKGGKPSCSRSGKPSQSGFRAVAPTHRKLDLHRCR